MFRNVSIILSRAKDQISKILLFYNVQRLWRKPICTPLKEYVSDPKPAAVDRYHPFSAGWCRGRGHWHEKRSVKLFHRRSAKNCVGKTIGTRITRTLVGGDLFRLNTSVIFAIDRVTSSPCVDRERGKCKVNHQLVERTPSNKVNSNLQGPSYTPRTQNQQHIY